MGPHNRFRAAIKWMALGAFIVFSVAWSVSTCRIIAFEIDATTDCWVTSGALVYGEHVARPMQPQRWSITPKTFSVEWRIVQWRAAPSFRFLWLGIWPFVLISGGLAGWLWYRDLRQRRSPVPGDCARCGYSRGGLGSHTRCPECGESGV